MCVNNMLVYKCDICGRIYKHFGFKNTAKLSSGNPFLGIEELDICDDCHTKIENYIKELQEECKNARDEV